MKRLHRTLCHLFLMLACLQLSLGLCLAQDTITTYVGGGSPGLLNYPAGIAMDGAGNLYIADGLSQRILRVTRDGVISTFANGGLMRIPTSIALDASGNVIVTEIFSIGNVITLDTFTNTVLEISPNGTMSRLGTTRQWYFFDYDFIAVAGADCVAGVATDSEGNVFVAETLSQSIWKITPAGGVILVAGDGNGTSGSRGDGGPATSARLSYPNGLAMDAGGNLFIADSNNNRIRKIARDGIITTVAGNGIAGFSGDGGPATSAQLSYPLGVAVDTSGNLFIADSRNNRIRKVTPEGIITTIAGNGGGGFSGDGGPPTLAHLNYPTSVAVDDAGAVFIADLYNNRIRKVVTTLTVPTLTSISPNLGARGVTVDVTLRGTGFVEPLTIDAGTGITVSDILVSSRTAAQARFTIAPDAELGTRELTVETGTEPETRGIPFTVVSPFPDLRVTTSHNGDLGVGFDEVFDVGVSNVGSTPTTSTLTLTDELPLGLSFVSGTGYGWSCAANDQTVTCTNPKVLPSGTSTTVKLKVAVNSNPAPAIIHAVSVSTEGDLDPSSNSASEVVTVVAAPVPTLRFSRSIAIPGQQETVWIAMPHTFPFEVAGSLTLGFLPNAAIPMDDPAIQFASGNRTVAFTIPANSLQPRFATASGSGQLGFQVGTVAGALTFHGTLRAGTVETTFSNSLTIPQSAPALQTVQTSTQEGFAALITSVSTTREVTQLNLTFHTTPAVRLSCGSLTGCSASGQSLTLDVRSLFNQWFAADTGFGGLSTLKIPLSINGNVHGTVVVMLRNSRGTSNTSSFTLP